MLFSHRCSLSSKDNQLHRWVFLLTCRTPHVVWPSTWVPAVHAAMHIHTSLCSPGISRLCCRCHRDCVKPGEVSLTHLILSCCSILDKNLKRMFLLYYKLHHQSKPGLCLLCFLLCEKNVVYHWSQLEPFDGFFLSSLCFQFNNN